MHATYAIRSSSVYGYTYNGCVGSGNSTGLEECGGVALGWEIQAGCTLEEHVGGGQGSTAAWLTGYGALVTTVRRVHPVTGSESGTVAAGKEKRAPKKND